MAFVAFAIIGLANPLVDVNTLTLMQRLAPESVLGRLFGALESVLIGAMALGALLMPLLVELVGLRWGLVILGAPVVVAVGICFPALARLDRTVAPPEKLGLVAALPIFLPLAPGVLENLARRLTPVTVAAGQTVITAGEPGDRFYLIERGRLDARRGAEVLSTMAAGDCFGEIALLRDVPRTATVVATDDAVLHALDREDFLAAVGADADARPAGPTAWSTAAWRAEPSEIRNSGSATHVSPESRGAGRTAATNPVDPRVTGRPFLSPGVTRPCGSAAPDPRERRPLG